MRNISRFIIPIVALLLGLISGIGLTAWRASKLINEIFEMHSGNSAMEKLKLLQQLRSNNNQQAIDDQERILAEELKYLVSQLQAGKGGESIRTTFQRVQAYQNQYPTAFHSGNLGNELEQTLSFVNKQK
ncbi:MAG: hypothetical protein HY823_14015 [Acidobacteria bacterium]|nr:hypothetical protein [Acidobacteriota bacterium]